VKTTIGAILVALTLALASPAAAQNYSQEQSFSIRLFGLGSSESFAASDTFKAAFDTSRGMFWGGGLEVVHKNGIFVDVEYSRFKKDGERAFISDGQVFKLGIPLTVTMAPIDALAGYRFRLGRAPVTPYVAVGITSLSYKESSTFSDASENTDTRKTGPMIVGGVELQLLRQLSVSVDVADTRVTGVLGSSGLSQQAGENDLGGVAARFRIIIGR
jgi:hypothetical protein